MAVSNEDPRMNENTASILDHDTYQPFARRSVSTILGFFLAIVLVGVFIGWYFFSPDSDDQAALSDNTVKPPVAEQMPGNSYEEGTGRSGVYNFFYKMFGGIEDGLEENPHNLKNTDVVDQFNIDMDVDENIVSSTPADTMVQLQQVYNQFENIDDGYRHSIYDIVGSDVLGRKGDKAGQVHDILIDKNTGEARAIVVNQDGTYYDRDLAKLSFKNILKQEPDGDVQATVAEDTLEEKNEFIYGDMKDRFVSLRHLRDGQVLDYQGNVAGEVDAIIYRNAEAQRIFFALKPSLSPTGKPKNFGIPYDAVQVMENPDGYDIKLTKEQTKSLAEELYGASE